MVEPVSADLLQLVFNEFKQAMCDIQNHPWEVQHGQPPKYGYIEQTEYVEYQSGIAPAIFAWHISPSTIRSTIIKEQRTPKVDGMFFDLFRGWFFFAPDLSAVYINWQTGPRYGRGFRHRIGKDTLGAYLLDRGSGTWVS